MFLGHGNETDMGLDDRVGMSYHEFDEELYYGLGLGIMNTCIGASAKIIAAGPCTDLVIPGEELLPYFKP